MEFWLQWIILLQAWNLMLVRTGNYKSNFITLNNQLIRVKILRLTAQRFWFRSFMSPLDGWTKPSRRQNAGWWSVLWFTVLCNGIEQNSTQDEILVRVPPITFTRMFEPRHNILSIVRTNVGKYVVAWLKHSRESNRRYPDQYYKFSISSYTLWRFKLGWRNISSYTLK